VAEDRLYLIDTVAFILSALPSAMRETSPFIAEVERG
jgi:hypothetical protein